MEDDAAVDGTMAMMDGVPVRSDWLTEEQMDLELLSRGVSIAREMATLYGTTAHSVDLDPVEGCVDALRVHVYVEGGEILAHVNLEDGSAKVYRIPAQGPRTEGE